MTIQYDDVVNGVYENHVLVRDTLFSFVERVCFINKQQVTSSVKSICIPEQNCVNQQVWQVIQCSQHVTSTGTVRLGSKIIKRRCSGIQSKLGPSSIAAVVIQHTAGSVSTGSSTTSQTLIQECIQCGGPAASFHQVLDGGSVLKHSHSG
jgi:hypothetical protein